MSENESEFSIFKEEVKAKRVTAYNPNKNVGKRTGSIKDLVSQQLRRPESSMELPAGSMQKAMVSDKKAQDLADGKIITTRIGRVTVPLKPGDKIELVPETTPSLMAEVLSVESYPKGTMLHLKRL